jgi:hypothetical protein
LETIICRLYGHRTTIENASSGSSSPTRTESLIASSTFPVMIDDCTDANPWILDFLKSYTTIGSNKTRMGAGAGKQFATINKPLSASLALTCNDPPPWFSDDAFLERCFIDVIDELIEHPRWREARDAFPTGGLTHLLYDFTKTWKIDDLKKFIADIPTPKITDTRKKYIYLAFAAGAKLLEKIFGLNVDLSPVMDILNKTRMANAETLMALMAYQVNHGKILEYIPPQASDDAMVFPDDIGDIKTSQQRLDGKKQTITALSNTNSNSTYYLPLDVWVKTPIGMGFDLDENNRKEEYYAWSVNNIRELQLQLEGAAVKKWSLNTFFIRIQKWFPKAQLGNWDMNHLENKQRVSRKTRCVKIPVDDFNLKQN